MKYASVNNTKNEVHFGLRLDMAEKIKKQGSAWTVAFVIGICFFGLPFLCSSEKDETKGARRETQTAETKLAEYRSQQDELLRTLDRLIAEKKWDEAVQKASAYKELDAPELQARYKKAREMQLADQVKSVPSDNLAINLAIYKELSELNPEEPRYRQRYQHYQSKLDERKKQTEAFVAKYGRAPIRSSWDGSNSRVERYLKQVLRDPNSLAMDNCSEPHASDDGWIMLCSYRAKNGFGGMNKEAKWFVFRNEEIVAYREPTYYSIK
jgi:hypothetical protein